MSLQTGEIASLACVSFGGADVEILWSFNGTIVGNTSRIAIYEVQGERIFKQSFLQICGLVEIDAGDYTCSISDGFVTANATIQLSLTSKFIIFTLAGYAFIAFFFCCRFSSNRGCGNI
jgi:hypothetical protein